MRRSATRSSSRDAASGQERKKTAGAVRATVAYEGPGDSGDITECRIVDGAGVEILAADHVILEVSSFESGGGTTTSVRSAHAMPLDDALRDFANEILEEWNNDGADGEVAFDVVADAVRIEHRAYFTDSDLTEVDL